MKKTFTFLKQLGLKGLISLLFCHQGFAQVSEAGSSGAAEGGFQGLYALAAGLTIAIAAFGGALGQGRVGAVAMEGIARNPQAQKIMFIPMIIVLALIESFVIFSFAIAMIIAGKL